jgi:threonine dehydratase
VHAVRITADDIEEAAKRIEQLVRRTPAITVDGSQLETAGTVSLKLEQLQHSGTFKTRGASNFMLSNEISPAGVVAASGGNHGAAVAWAASQLGHKATIFVPTISAPAKVDRLLSYGADVRQVGAVYAGALQASVEHQASSGATPIHAYEDPAVMAGAGTTGRELEDQVAPMDAVLVACGGGGLAGGIATWLGARTRVIACETEHTDGYAQALAAGQPVDVHVSGIAADALGATRIGDLAWEQLSAVGAASVLVTDDEVAQARMVLWDRFRILVEPSAAVPIAALLTGRYQPSPTDHTGVIVCGANTKLD